MFKCSSLRCNTSVLSKESPPKTKLQCDGWFLANSAFFNQQLFGTVAPSWDLWAERGLTCVEEAPAGSYLGPGQKQLGDQQQAGAPSGPQGDRVQPFFLMWSLHPMADCSIVRHVDGTLSSTHRYTHAHTAAGQVLKTQIVQNSTFFISERRNNFKHSLKALYWFMLTLLTDKYQRLQNTNYYRQINLYCCGCGTDKPLRLLVLHWILGYRSEFTLDHTNQE